MNKGPLTPELQAEVNEEKRLADEATAFLRAHGMTDDGRDPSIIDLTDPKKERKLEMAEGPDVPIVYNMPKKQ